MQTHDHYFSFSALESFWENTHSMAQSFTQPSSPSSKPSFAKPPLSPRGRYDGRPPLSPVSSMHTTTFDESVETIMSPRSIDDVRLFVVRDLGDIPDLYDYGRSTSDTPTATVTESSSTTTTTTATAAATATAIATVTSDCNSLDFTQDTPSVEALRSRTEEEEAPSFATDDEELIGLDLLENEEQPKRAAPSPPPAAPAALVQLDLDFLKQDPPKAHTRLRRSHF